MRKIYRKFIGLTCMVGIFFSSIAQVKTKTFENRIPEQFLPLQSSISKIKLVQPSAEFYKLKVKSKEKDVAEEKTPLSKFASSESVSIDFLQEASLTDVNGISSYALTIKTHDAISLTLRFGTFFLSPNAILSIYNDHELTDSITSKENNNYKTWVSRTYEGSTLNIVLKIPIVEKGKSILKINAIDFGYKGRFGSPGASASCNINVACSLGSGWEAERNSVAIIQASNGTASGVLIMNTCGTNVPNLLTAKHVVDAASNSPSGWTFQFFFYSTSCSTNTGYREDVQFYGATLVASNGTSDFALLQLSQIPAANSGICYSGWNRTSSYVGVTQVTGLHHPNGDVMKISRSTNYPTIGRYNTSSWAVNWTQGITANGSSGSPLYDQNHRILGQLWDGNSSCSTPNAADWYGSLDYSWSGGGTNSTRLSNWLDPNGSGAVTINTTSVNNLISLDPNSYPISGSDAICTSAAYSVANVPSGATVQWQASPAWMVTLNPNGSQVNVTKNYNGTFNLSATITTCAGATITPTKNSITSGLTFEGTYSTSYDGAGPLIYSQQDYNYIYEYSYVWAHLWGSPQWSLMDGTISSWNFNGYNLEFYLSPNDWVTFRATITSGGCTSSQDFTFVAQPNYYYRIAPNPASSDITVYVDEEKLKKQKIGKSSDQNIQKIMIMDKLGNVLMQQSYPSNTTKATLNINRLHTDMYIVKIFNGTKWVSIKFLKK
jgi:lysyl endopeptidase